MWAHMYLAAWLLSCLLISAIKSRPNSPAGALLRAAPPAAAKQHSQQPAQPQIGKDGKPIDPVAIANYGISLAPAAREASPAAPPPKPLPLPPPQGRRVAHFTPAQVKQLAEALQIVTTTELKVQHAAVAVYELLMANVMSAHRTLV